MEAEGSSDQDHLHLQSESYHKQIHKQIQRNKKDQKLAGSEEKKKWKVVA